MADELLKFIKKPDVGIELCYFCYNNVNVWYHCDLCNVSVCDSCDSEKLKLTLFPIISAEDRNISICINCRVKIEQIPEYLEKQNQCELAREELHKAHSKVYNAEKELADLIKNTGYTKVYNRSCSNSWNW